MWAAAAAFWRFRRLLLGCDRAVGVEIDPTAVRVAEENSAINHTDDRVQFICGDLVQKVEGVYDIVCCQHCCRCDHPAAAQCGPLMAEDAVLITSGIIDEREADVQAALAQNGFAVLRRRESARLGSPGMRKGEVRVCRGFSVTP